MPYFKNEEGAKGYVNDEEVMSRLEGEGYVRLKGKELFLRLVIEALKDWGLPGVASTLTFLLTDDFALSTLAFWVTQQILK